MYVEWYFQHCLFWKVILKIVSCSAPEGSTNSGGMKDQRIWSIQECADVLKSSVGKLKGELLQQGDGGMLVWDKVNKYLVWDKVNKYQVSTS